ncbi:uncharacterized protein LOC133744804 [Rosa rugosa]|uniref:uncharacterized protein LOC133744804 n=1 Tax=Rosa rugosa TaxID=74645 RepID=UPI002B4025E9|nr:uncharacterized protein LOC133744804 [Rosa rugosa]
MRYEYEQVNGYAPDRITFFTMTHTREDGTVVDAESADIIAKFKNGLKEYEDRQEILTDEIRHKVYSDVLGPEKRNRVRGYGLGVQFTDVPGVVTEARGMCREVHTLRAAWEQQKQATEEAHVEIESLRLANINLAEELRHEQAVTMEAHKKKMEDSFAKMKENMMNEVNKLFHNSSSTDGERGVMENQMASKDRIDEEDCVMADQENVEVYSPIMPFDLNSL